MAHVDPSSLQPPVERRLREALLAHEALGRASAARVGPWRLRSQAFRLTSTTAPFVMEALNASQAVLGYSGPVEVCVQPEARCQALALRGSTSTPLLLLSSRLVEVLSPSELRFVLGRALGHWVLGHLEAPPLASAVTEDPFWRTAPPEVVLKASLWRQAAKVSADRAGLLCARDLEAAASALFKLSSGLSTASVRSELRMRLREVEALLAGGEVPEPSHEASERLGGFGTHPFSPLRLRALAAFSLTRTFRGGADLYASEEGRADEDADTLLARELRALEPPAPERVLAAEAIQDSSERARLLRYNCWVAAAHGDVTEEFLTQTQSLAETWSLPFWIIDEALQDASRPLD